MGGYSVGGQAAHLRVVIGAVLAISLSEISRAELRLIRIDGARPAREVQPRVLEDVSATLPAILESGGLAATCHVCMHACM